MSSNSSDGASGGGGSLTLTASRINFASDLSGEGIIPGTCMCFVILLAYGVVACFPRARASLDRVSFRLLVYALAANVGFGIAYDATPSAPGPRCNVGAFFINLFLTLSTFFTACIAINLQLVLIHRKNGQRLEKYYVLGTILLTLALNIPPLALQQFGWDEEAATCWYQNENRTRKLYWLIGTSSFWIALATTVETICSAVVLIWMFFYQRTTGVLARQAAFGVAQMHMGKENEAGPAVATPQKKDRASKGFAAHDRVYVENFIQKRPTDIMKDPRYRNAILRIALYPIVSLLCNYPTVALDLRTTIQAGLRTENDFRALVLDLFIYAIRPLAYGLIAATDPSFITAVREAIGKPRKTRSKSASDEISGKLPEFASVTGGSESAIAAVSTTDTVLQCPTETQTGRVNRSQVFSGAGNTSRDDECLRDTESRNDRMKEGMPHATPAQGDEEIGSVPFDYEENLREATRQI